jgi:hypothetical protein
VSFAIVRLWTCEPKYEGVELILAGDRFEPAYELVAQVWRVKAQSAVW